MASTPEKIRAALLRVEQKFDKLRRHAKQLEWNLKNAEALENLAGWVGVVDIFFHMPNTIFPVGKNDERRLDLYGFSAHDEQNLGVRRTAIEPYQFISRGKFVVFEKLLIVGFFATRKEARNFVEEMEYKITPKEI